MTVLCFVVAVVVVGDDVDVMCRVKTKGEIRSQTFKNTIVNPNIIQSNFDDPAVVSSTFHTFCTWGFLLSFCLFFYFFLLF